MVTLNALITTLNISPETFDACFAVELNIWKNDQQICCTPKKWVFQSKKRASNLFAFQQSKKIYIIDQEKKPQQGDLVLVEIQKLGFIQRFYDHRKKTIRGIVIAIYKT